MNDNEFVYNNEEEAEMGQLHAIHLSMNAVGKVQQEMEKQRSQPSLCHCEECGEEIPEDRRKANKGVKTCIFCQELKERGVL